MSCKAPVRIVALVLAVLLVMNVTSILTNLSVFAQTQEDYAVIGIEMNGKTSVVEYRAKDDCSLVVAVYDDDGAKMLGSGNTTVAANKQSAEVEISIDEMPQDYLVKAFLVSHANNYPLCEAYVDQEHTEENNQVSLSNLQSDEEYFVCGLDNVITFTVDVTGEPDSVQLYKNDTELVGEMHDDGLNGDEKEGDGKYTCVANENILEDKTITFDYFAKSDEKTSNSITIHFFEELTEESQNIIVKTQKQIGIIASNYANENGYVTIDDLPIIISSVANYIKGIKEEGTVLWYEVNADNILIRFSSGFLLGFTPEVEGFQNGGSNVNIVSLQPFANSIGLSTTVIDYTAQYIDESLNNYTFQSNIDNEDVTIDTIISSLSNNQIVLWDGHGGFSDTYHSALVTGQKCDLSTDVLVLANKISKFLSYNKVSFLRDNTQGKLIPCSGIFPISRWAITSRFIDAYCHQMTNSFIWLGACYSGKDSVLASAFINKGATCVVGYSDTVVCFYHRAILTKTITSMLQINENTNDYFTLGEGVDIAKQTHGDNDKIKYSDVYHPKGAEPRIFGGEKAENYRLANVEESGKCGDDITYFLRNDGTLFLSGNGEMYNYDSADDVPWHNRRNNITSVEFEGAITSIGDRCFLNCGNLTNVTLPDTVTTIGVDAFRKCQKIIDINIPDSVISIKDGAFYECKALKNVSFGSSLKSIGEWVFAYTSVSSILFPESIESVGGKCFFAGYLNKVIIPESLTNFGLCVFQYCGGLKTVGPIGSNSNIEYGWKNSIPKKVFFGSSIEEIMIKDTIEVIEEGAFQSCDYLTTIKLPNSLKSIHRSAFRGCHTLQTIDLPESVSFIDADVFDGCYKLEDIVLPNSITAINDQTFDYCYALKSIVIPKSVTYIGQQAFESCSNLKAIYYTGSEEDWKKIKFGQWAGISTPTVYNYDPTQESIENPSPSPSPTNSPDTSGTLSATFDTLIPNANYIFVVSKSSSLDNMLDASNLLFIDEKTAGDSGSLTFGYIPREDYEGAVVKIFGPVNPSVTLDTTSATLKKGDKLTITAMVDQGHSANDVVWSSSNDKIATVSKGEVTAVGFGDAEISARLDDCVVKCVVSVVPDLDFTILGASIRLSEPYGIRFGIQLGKGGDYTNVKIVEYGTLMKPTQLLGDEELTLQTAKIQKIPSTVTYSETDAALVYTGVLINIPTTYFDTAVSGRGYFIYEDENGVNHTIYTDTVSMSFNDVVEAAYNKYSKLTNPTDAQKVVLQKLEKLRALSGNN